MKSLQKPKAYAIHKILINGKNAGRIQLVKYLQGDAKPHIEFVIKQEYRNQGVMSRELPKYLKERKEYNPQIIAVVKRDNPASIKLLEKNGFVKITGVNDNVCFVIDLNLTADILKKTVVKIKRAFPVRRQLTV